MELPDILSEARVKDAAELLKRYYLVPDEKTGLLSTGSYFDEWAGRGDAPKVKDRITDSDLVAVSMLSIPFPAKAAIGFQEPAVAKQITELLTRIPSDRKLSELTKEQAQDLLGKESAAVRLWRVLRATDAPRWGVGPTTASKILARKRPHLIPIWDVVIGQVIGKRSAVNQWLNWHALLQPGTGLAARLNHIHELSGVTTDLAEIRIMDAVLWRHGRDLGYKGGRIT